MPSASLRYNSRQPKTHDGGECLVCRRFETHMRICESGRCAARISVAATFAGPRRGGLDVHRMDTGSEADRALSTVRSASALAALAARRIPVRGLVSVFTECSPIAAADGRAPARSCSAHQEWVTAAPVPRRNESAKCDRHASTWNSRNKIPARASERACYAAVRCNG